MQNLLCNIIVKYRYEFVQLKLPKSMGPHLWGPTLHICCNVEIKKKNCPYYFRTSYGHANINDMNHHLDTEIQACTNEDLRFCIV